MSGCGKLLSHSISKIKSLHPKNTSRYLLFYVFGFTHLQGVCSDVQLAKIYQMFKYSCYRKHTNTNITNNYGGWAQWGKIINKHHTTHNMSFGESRHLVNITRIFPLVKAYCITVNDILSGFQNNSPVCCWVIQYNKEIKWAHPLF